MMKLLTKIFLLSFIFANESPFSKFDAVVYPQFYYNGVMVEIEGSLKNERTPLDFKMIMPTNIDSVFFVEGAISQGNTINVEQVKIDSNIKFIERTVNESEFKMFLFYALGEESGRTIGSFDLNINHDIDEAHVVVQKPLKSEVFSLSASTSDIFLDENKIEYHRIHVNNYKKNLSKIFTFEYLNPGKVLTASFLQNNQSPKDNDNISNKPIRYSVPTWQPLTVLLLFFGGLGFLYSNQKKHSDNSKNRKEQSVNRKSRKKFCTECGSPVELKDKYCSNCGAKI